MKSSSECSENANSVAGSNGDLFVEKGTSVATSSSRVYEEGGNCVMEPSSNACVWGKR